MMMLRILALLIALLAPSLSLAQWVNEPAGFTTVLDCPFSTTTCNGQLLDPYGTSGGNLTIQSDGSAPFSPTNVLRSTMNYQTANGGTQLEFHGPVLTNAEIFVGLWWRTNPEFTGSSVNTNKMFTIRGGPNENGFFLLRTNPGQSKIIHWSTQLAYNLDKCGGAPDIDVCYPNVTTTPISPGTWYKIEVYMRASTCPTCKNGVWMWWINGILNGNYTNVAYGPRVDEWVWTETWDGGGSGQGFTTNPAHFIDHLHISVPNCTGNCSGGGNLDNPPGASGTVTGVTVTVGGVQ